MRMKTLVQLGWMSVRRPHLQLWQSAQLRWGLLAARQRLEWLALALLWRGHLAQALGLQAARQLLERLALALLW